MDKLEMLTGTWETEDADSRLIINIKSKGGRIRVTAYDRYDSEKFKVSDVNWDGEELFFILTVPSNGYQTTNRIKPEDQNSITQKITFEERWTRKPLTPKKTLKKNKTKTNKLREPR